MGGGYFKEDKLYNILQKNNLQHYLGTKLQ